MADLKGKTLFITGASRGIGKAIALRAAADGANIAIAAKTAEPNPKLPGTIHTAAEAIEAAGGEALAMVGDVREDAQVEDFVARAAERWGRVEIVVNNASAINLAPIAALPPKRYDLMLDINTRGTFLLTRTALPHLRGSAHPSVVNVGSAVAVVGVPNRALYSATKGAVLSLTLAMAADHVREGIRVNAVAPGTADTPWVARLIDATDDPAAELAALEARQPIGRLVGAEEVANAIAYLASPLSGSTTGTVLGADGGMATLRLPT